MPHSIIEISELTQLIADHCLLGDEKSLVSLACTCRALEEQALITLWSEQSSLVTLVKSTLPPGILPLSNPLLQPTNAEWDRFREYASWMRRLIQKWDSGIPEAVFHSLSLWSAEGVLCPGLRLLHWESHSRILPLHRLVLSPTLTNLSLTYSSYYYESPELELSIIQPAIMGLDTSPFRDLRLQWYVSAESSKQMESVASSAVLRCGPALKNLAMYSPLSDAAVQHTMKGPPRIPNLSLSDSFPRLDHLSLISEASYEWLPLFTATPRHISFGQRFCSPLNSGPTKRLGRLVAHWRIPIDAVFMAPVMLFRELISLRLTSACSTGLIAAPSCAFSLTDDDIADIAAALTRLKVARVFGQLMPNHRHLPRLIFHVLQGLGTSGNSLQHGKSSQRPRARVYGPST